MSPYIKEPKRSRHLVHKAIIDALGGYKAVAGALLVAPVTVSKWAEDPEGSGQDIPVRHLQSLLGLVGKNLTNLQAQNAADELMQEHFLALYYRRSYPEEKVFQFIEMLQGQAIGKAVNE